MKALRRTIKREKASKANASLTQKSAVAIAPPKKVIRALYNYEAKCDQQLSFSRGDFFYVIGRENDQDWYEACNPAVVGARGLVPVGFFQILCQPERDTADSPQAIPKKKPDHDSGYSETFAIQPTRQAQTSPPPTTQGTQAGANAHRIPKSGKSNAMVYGIVMHDFAAEWADELEAKAGEAIVVIAQSNPEWLVAKPIGRLGGPGLIPVSFVEIRNVVSDEPVENPIDAIKRAGIPNVEEWNKMAAEYKNNSITLGKLGGNGPPGQPGQSAKLPSASVFAP